MTTTPLKNTAWLAQRLNLSETTIERLRAKGGTDLPPHLTIGRSIRYDPNQVESWCSERLHASSQGAGSVK